MWIKIFIIKFIKIFKNSSYFIYTSACVIDTVILNFLDKKAEMYKGFLICPDYAISRLLSRNSNPWLCNSEDQSLSHCAIAMEVNCFIVLLYSFCDFVFEHFFSNVQSTWFILKTSIKVNIPFSHKHILYLFNEKKSLMVV